MCGIVGFIDSHRQMDSDELRSVVRTMTKTLRHRGPEGCRTWIEEKSGLALGHQWLSITAPMHPGRQPYVSGDGEAAFVMNGEIYNYRELRGELERQGQTFASACDAEVMFVAFKHWGVDRSLIRLRGMFAFAFWNGTHKTLYLGRDRMGQKPLYFGWMDGYFLFASELRAFRSHPACELCIDPDAFALYMRLNYIPSPFSIYQGVYKLRPGELAVLTESCISGRQMPEQRAYWSLKELVSDMLKYRDKLAAEEIPNEWHLRFSKAVSNQMRAGVEVGAFLSGGIDTSSVVAMMQSNSLRPVKTYSLGFDYYENDDIQFARCVARVLGTEHNELLLRDDMVPDVVQLLPTIYDEPFADPSQIPMVAIARFARQAIRVVLTGEGGDELFGGYPRYLWLLDWQRKVMRIPWLIRLLISQWILAVPDKVLDFCFSSVDPLLKRHFPKPKMGSVGYRLHRLAKLARVKTPHRLYMRLISRFDNPQSVILGGMEPRIVLTESDEIPIGGNLLDWMMYVDQILMADGFLTKVDRATMAVGLEARAPFLDEEIVAFSWVLPLTSKICDGVSKCLLREEIYKHLPPSISQRPKQGFMPPIGSWLKSCLREWAEDLISPSTLREQGLLRVGPVRSLWTEHLAGRGANHTRLWNVLMFQAWLKEWHGQ